MANAQHLRLLKHGVERWNKWRGQNKDITPDFNGADLFQANLNGANLSQADFSWAHLAEADLGEAQLRASNLSWADLSRADLSRADLRGAALFEANLSRANLSWATLTATTLRGADLARATLSETVFGDTDLTAVRGLATCNHWGPSTLDHRTLVRSGPLPLAFLRGCGVPDWELEAIKLHQPGLTPTQINDIVYRIYGLRADPLIQFHSCFISYASKDQAFAERLYADLQNKGVRCWFAPEDLKIGDRLRPRIDETIRLYDKLLLVLSQTSVTSQWVEEEVEIALARERQQGTPILFPVRIDNTVMTIETGWPALIRNTRNIGDFQGWETHGVYQKAFDRLLRDLKAAERQAEG